MTSEPRLHSDLLRRFVPTPYVFNTCCGPSRICVESNDLEIALGVRRSVAVQRQGDRKGGLLCRLIRDMVGPQDHPDLSIFSDAALRVLCLGQGTIVVHDYERSEILGFISRTVKVRELVAVLIPALLDAGSKQ
jgi:hypothetical protein